MSPVVTAIVFLLVRQKNHPPTPSPGATSAPLRLLKLMGEFQYDELGRPDRGDADFYDHAPFEHILGCHGFAQTHIYEIGCIGSCAGHCALFPQPIEVTFD